MARQQRVEALAAWQLRVGRAENQCMVESNSLRFRQRKNLHWRVHGRTRQGCVLRFARELLMESGECKPPASGGQGGNQIKKPFPRLGRRKLGGTQTAPSRPTHCAEQRPRLVR